MLDLSLGAGVLRDGDLRWPGAISRRESVEVRSGEEGDEGGLWWGAVEDVDFLPVLLFPPSQILI